MFAGDLNDAYARAGVRAVNSPWWCLAGSLMIFNRILLEIALIIWQKWHGWSNGRT